MGLTALDILVLIAVGGAAILGLIAKFWYIVVPAWTFLVSIVAWPAGFAGGKWAKP